jgi:hypothetical protein
MLILYILYRMGKNVLYITSKIMMTPYNNLENIFFYELKMFLE